jgi:hypothetical protein
MEISMCEEFVLRICVIDNEWVLYSYWILGEYVFETILCQILTFTQWYPLNICTHIISISTISQGHLLLKQSM